MAQQQEIIIKPGMGAAHYWRDIWRYRELFLFLAWRDILVRYKQTAIGLAWCLIRPLLTMIVFTVVFGRIAGLSSQGAPYPVMVFTALLPWQFFSGSLTDSSSSLVGNSSLISKIYFPQMIIPSGAIVVSLVDFCISAVLLGGLLLWYGFIPGVNVFFLPAFLLLAVLVSLGTGLWFSALTVKYRDFRYVVPFLLQLGLYISPVGFSSSVVPEKWRFLYYLNPMVGVIDGFRWAVLGGEFTVQWWGIVMSTLLALFILLAGVFYFRRVERTFADVV